VVDGPVPGRAGLGFGGLLRRLRDDAGLTQDELAEAAAVSQRAISDLERGVNATARKDTAVLLAGALGLDGPARDPFVAAARGRVPASEALAAVVKAAATGSAASRTLPRDVAAFTGQLIGAGAVTFLFTDIEGSTALLRRVGEDVYARLLADHHALVRSVLAAHDGRELNTLGDGFFAAFSSPRACVAAVVQMQQALEGHAWPAGERVRVRMGVHTGEASDTAVGPVGLDVHRAARVAAVAHGGQVLVSETAAALVLDALPPGVALVDLGVHQLKDLGRPERIFQVSAPDLQAEFPPLRTLSSPAAAATRTLPRDVGSFTGREPELARLLAGPAEGGGSQLRIHAIDGMAGIGKTTFAVHAAHRLADRFPDGQFFLPLHAHTPGQRPVDPADALASLLLTAGVPLSQIPSGTDARAASWRDHLAGKKVLLVLDDAAGHEHVRPLLPGTPGSLVLITSRRRLAALEDAAVVSLDTLTPGEAAGLLARLAGRADVTAGDPAVGELAKLCGYLPLAIGMTGGQLAHHPAWTPADLAADLAAAKDRLELMSAENLSVAAAFGLSYRDLTAAQRRLFRRLGLHPGPDIDAYAAAALDGTGVAAARRRLEALYDQHLITEPARGRYRFHDLIREHARTLGAAGDPAARHAAATRLLDYYLHTARAAGQHFPAFSTAEGPAPPGRRPASAPPVSTPRQAAAWLEDERANLHAAAGYAAAGSRPRYAVLIPAAMDGFLQTRGYWDQGLVLGQAALAAARQAGDRPGQAHALLLLGSNMQGMTGDHRAAAASATAALQLYRDLGDRAGQADALHMIGFLHVATDDYPAAAAELHQALELFGDLGHRFGQANALNELGAVHRYTGDYPAAAACHRQAVELYRDAGHRPGHADALTNLGTVQRLAGDYPAATATLQQAQQLFRDLGDRYQQAMVLREFAAVQRLTGDYRSAAASSQRAIEQFHDLRQPRSQAYALNELGLVQQLTGDYPAAAASHQQALGLSRDLGDRLGQAETLNSLGELSSRTAASHRARDHHARALAIAREIGTPLEEARALEGIGRSHLHDGHAGEGTACLRQAITIYQRIAAPAARRVRETLLQLRQDKLAPTPEW
jgi:class 3 adenylate cyclase/tetratricopeptide (TPR) repeat protein/DNA-binding XRE family transcriptional regulator